MNCQSVAQCTVGNVARVVSRVQELGRFLGDGVGNGDSTPGQLFCGTSDESVKISHSNKILGP